MKVLVYTSITNNHDDLKPQPKFEEDKDLEIEYRAYLDNLSTDVNIVSNWYIEPTIILFKDPKRNGQIYKILSHLYSEGFDYTVWIDGSVVLKSSITRIINDHMFEGSSDIALLKHSERNCIYKESWDCKHFNLDNHIVIGKQMDFYRDVGYPSYNGLSETPLIIRRNTKNVIEFNSLWWSIICRYSKRDQLSFDFVRWTLGTSIANIQGNIHSNDYFEIKKHQVLREHERKD